MWLKLNPVSEVDGHGGEQQPQSGSDSPNAKIRRLGNTGQKSVPPDHEAQRAAEKQYPCYDAQEKLIVLFTHGFPSCPRVPALVRDGRAVSIAEIAADKYFDDSAHQAGEKRRSSGGSRGRERRSISA
jgi:hypothetical protein